MQQPATGLRPRLVVAALRGGAGKTILTVGLVAALRDQGEDVAVFKKGPDYIDAGWLALAAGRPCYNLDTYLLPAAAVRSSFSCHSRTATLALVEGNRGLFDGIDLDGATSTAELAKLLEAPVLLCLDATKTTRTLAAVVAGCRNFDARLRLAGVVLNRVAGSRHESICRRSIEHYGGLPVLGALPRFEEPLFPERHMGLVPTPEHGWAPQAVGKVREFVAAHVDLAAVKEAASRAVPLEESSADRPGAAGGRIPPAAVRIGVFRDAAFQFYYPENLESLEAAGAELVFLSPLTLGEAELERIHALYIGGGFPETHAGELSAHVRARVCLRGLVEEGLPVYAECGGLMYLGRELVTEKGRYAMAGVLPLSFEICRRPQGHGYTRLEVVGENPFFARGTEIRGHEFHYSRAIEWAGEEKMLVFRMRRGVGIVGDRDGITHRNVLATYTHVHALGTPAWAEALVRRAAAFRDSRGR
ncbi:MAG: cobyrinate a,c-diamide synthase [Desulfobacterales bacterium]